MGAKRRRPVGAPSGNTMQITLRFQVMVGFKIDIRSIGSHSWDDPQAIALRSGGICFTELVRRGENNPDEHLHAPPIHLAFWLIDNWWRLRWEPMVSDNAGPDWRLAHTLSDIGGGYIWPRLQIWGEDPYIGLASIGDPVGTNSSVRFTTSTEHPLFVNAEQFEGAVDQFLERAVNAQSNDRDALKAQYSALNCERNDQDFSTWRRLEAMSGYDADSAPDNLIQAFLGNVEKYGLDGVGEAIAAVQGEVAQEALEASISFAEQSGVICDFREASSAANSVEFRSRAWIWEQAEIAAKEVRNRSGCQKGPLKNGRLAEILNVSKYIFRGRKTSATELQYGLRLKIKDEERSAIALRARWPQGQRFELCRSLGDAIWSDSDSLGPMTSTKTGRQKFQRAFAQSLLCPWEELRCYMNTDEPTEDDVSAAARYFDVSERVVQTVLINKRRIDRPQFDQLAAVA